MFYYSKPNTCSSFGAFYIHYRRCLKIYKDISTQFAKLVNKISYQTNIGVIRLILKELQVANKQAKKIMAEKLGKQD